jgi:hypothetical protein
MTIQVVNMIDATHANVRNVARLSIPKIALYVTGTTDIQATPADWAMFPHAGHVRINQGYQASAMHVSAWDVPDIESGAFTPADVPGLVKARKAAGIGLTTPYATDSTLAAVRDELEAAGPHGWYYGNVDCWLADWNLNFGQAAALLGTLIHGMTCRAVQWASPTSNPDTVIPGSSVTLQQAQVDLSAADAAWFPAPHPVPAPMRRLLVASDLTSKITQSTDGGKTWH